MAEPTTGIAEAIRAAGGQEALGESLGVSQQVVSTWHKRGWVPLARVEQIARRYSIDRLRLMDPKVCALLGGAKPRRRAAAAVQS